MGRTARIGGLSPKLSGWNYIAECEAAIQRSCSEAAEIRAGLLAVLKSDLPSFVATYACPFNGLHHWFEVLISAFEFNGKRNAILMHVDVSALQHDPLTGLPNRAMFDAQLDLALSLARDIGRQTGVIIVDMNKLKLINDMYGHRIGDEALKALATGAQEDGRSRCWRPGSEVTNSGWSFRPITIFCPRGERALVLDQGSLAQSEQRVIRYPFPRASESRFIPTTARPPPNFSHQPISRCTHRSVRYRSLRRDFRSGSNRVVSSVRQPLPVHPHNRTYRCVALTDDAVAMLFVFAIFLFGLGDIFGERRFLLRCYLVYDRRPYPGRFDGAAGGNAECAARAHSITRGATG